MTYIPSSEISAPLSGLETSDVQELARTEGVRVLDYTCRASAASAPTADHFRQLSIIVVRDGAFCYSDHGYTRLLEPGAVVLGCSGESYHCTHAYGCGDRGTVFQFTDGAVAQLQADLACRTRPRPAVFAQAPLREALVAAASARQATTALALDEAAYGLAASVLRALDGSAAMVPPSLRRADRDRAHAAAQLIERRFGEALDLHTLAAEVATSPFHFLRLFRQELGLTPHQYLVRTRLRHAIHQLASTNSPVTAIALAVGFGDLTNFIRTFRRHVGEPPSAFRRRLA
ncbi:MAG: transcriptional regulator, AraC family [Cyanobacteria bacterium RYN_339]|nr:transcriptional regulator, AraC family [Cyanobacteria bacterium RYN_339]